MSWTLNDTIDAWVTGVGNFSLLNTNILTSLAETWNGGASYGQSGIQEV